MIFWIVVGLLAAFFVVSTVWHIRDRHSDLADWSCFTPPLLIVGTIIGCIFVGIGANASVTISEPTLAERSGLRALVTQEADESSGEATFFLGFGYASTSTSEVTSISYIRVADDGGSTLRKSSIDESVIYEDSSDVAYMEEWVTTKSASSLWIPWDYSYVHEREYRFHIPAGSILEQYEVTP